MNLIVITVDALRKETLKCYNEKEGISIGFEDFYKKGLIFDHMFTTIPQTYGALGSLFTGLYPYNHKIGIEPYDRKKLTLFDYLKDTHSILLFTTEPPLGESLTYKEYEEYNLELEEGRVDLRKSPIDVSRLLNYIEENKERDFFFTTHIWTPRKYGVYQENDFSKLLAEKRYSEVWLGSLRLVEEVGVAINKIFLFLRAKNLLGKTIVVITSDHGDYFVSDSPVFGFHLPRAERKTGSGHGTHYNPEINIPFILYHPEIVPKRFSQVISIVDAMPTLLSFLSKPLRTKIDGVNRESFLKGKEKFSPRDVFIDRLPTHRVYTIIDPEGWKFTSYLDSGFHLYNIFRDPEELEDLAKGRLDIVEKSYRKLYSYPIDISIKKKDIFFRYLNYWNIDHVRGIFDKFGIDDWKKKVPFFEKIRWVTDQALLSAIIDQISSQKALKVLEIGIGTGILSKMVKKLHPSFSVTGIDLSPSMLSHIKKEDEIVIRTGDAHRLSFANESFDVILTRGVLPYLEDPLQVFQEVFRVSKNSSFFILCEETAQSEQLFPIWKKINTGNLFYKNSVYSRGEIKELFFKAGFSDTAEKEILFHNYSLNNYLLIHNRHEKATIKRRYHDSPLEYRNFVNFHEEKDIRSGQPYGDIFVDINFSIFKGKKL